jgi:mevalonate kinase
MAKGSGFGKVILFNEHFVVYGIPSIASAIDSKTETMVKRVSTPEHLIPSGTEGSMAGSGWVLEDARPANPGYKTEKFDHQKQSIEYVFTAAGFDPKEHNIRIHMGGDLKSVGGVGASAAVCVSLARALNEEFSLGFDDTRINEIAYEGEKAYAGTPSGIDNTCSTFGGLLRFKKNLEGGENTIEHLNVKSPIRIVMGNTGITANTKAAVTGVRERRDADPDRYAEIFREAEELGAFAQKALDDFDLDQVGWLMNRNHDLLQQIEVSHPKLDELVDIARNSGAIGAKMTGGGLGGYMVALTPDEETQTRVAEAMRAAGYDAHPTMIGI